MLTNIMSEMVCDTFKIIPVTVKSETDDVTIEDKTLNNSTFSDYDDVNKFYEGTISTLGRG